MIMNSKYHAWSFGMVSLIPICCSWGVINGIFKTNPLSNSIINYHSSSHNPIHFLSNGNLAHDQAWSRLKNLLKSKSKFIESKFSELKSKSVFIESVFLHFCFRFRYNFDNIKKLRFDIFQYKIQPVLFR